MAAHQHWEVLSDKELLDPVEYRVVVEDGEKDDEDSAIPVLLSLLLELTPNRGEHAFGENDGQGWLREQLRVGTRTKLQT